VPRLRPLVPGLSPQKPEFDPNSLHMRFVVDKNCERYFFQYLIFALSVSLYYCTILIFLTPNRYIILAIEASLNDTCNTLRQ
jgi:hypothetical protein